MNAIPRWLAITIVFLPLSQSHCQSVLLDEKFSRGDFATQNPPQSAAWLANEGAVEKSERDGFTLSNANEVFRALAYFVDQSPVVLEEGQTLTLICKFSVAGNLEAVPGVLRVALLSSQGFRVASGGSLKSFDFSKYQGYALSANLLGIRKGASLTLSARDGRSSKSLMHVGEAWTRLGSGGGQITFEENQEYTLKLSVRRKAGEISLTTSISVPGANGEQVIAADPKFHCTKFDTVAISGIGGRVFETITLSSVKVSLDSGW